MPRNVAAERDELGHHAGEHGEAQPARGRAEIDPRCVEDRLRLLGHLERIGDPIHAVRGGLEEVAVLRGENLPIGVAPRFTEIGQGIHDLHAQVDVIGDGFPRSGNRLLDGVDVVLDAVAQGDVQLFTRVGHDQAKGLRDLHPVQVDPQLILEKLSHAPFVGGRSHVGDQVHGGLEFESPPHEAAGEATWNVVLLHEQHLHALGRQLCRGTQATVSRANHDAVVGPAEGRRRLLDHVSDSCFDSRRVSGSALSRLDSLRRIRDSSGFLGEFGGKGAPGDA